MPTQARSRRTYAAIVEAGARLLARGGYEALTTNGVAEVAGVGIASLYEYFPNKQSLVAAVVGHVLEELVADLQRSSERLLAELHRYDDEEAMALWIEAMFAAVTKHRRLVGVIVREVPFLWEIPAVDAAREALLAIATAASGRNAQARGKRPLSEAMVYVLTTMTGAAILEAVLRPPSYSPASVIKALTTIVNHVMRAERSG